MIKLKIFEKPNQNKLYSIGADVALGIAEGDFSTLFVIDNEYTQAACYHGHIDPDLFGSFMCQVGKYYNNAILTPEVNNMGHTTLTKIKSLGYSNVYTRQVQEEHSDEYTKKLGWNTNRKTKHEMLNGFVAAVRDDIIKIKDVELLKEMIQLYIESDGDINLNGKDRVVAACLALQGLQQQIGDNYDAFIPGKTRPKTLMEKLDQDSKKRSETL